MRAKQLCFDIFSPLSTSRCPIARQAHRSRVFLRSLPHSGKLERNLETFEPPVYPLLYYVYRNGDGHRYLFTGLSTKSFLVSWLLGMDSCRLTKRERERGEPNLPNRQLFGRGNIGKETDFQLFMWERTGKRNKNLLLLSSQRKLAAKASGDNGLKVSDACGHLTNLSSLQVFFPSFVSISFFR